MGTSIGIAGVFCGCCLNAIFLELLVKGDPGSGNLITFAQFFFIALEGYIFTMNFGRKERYIPLRSYVIVVVMFFIANVCNNFAFNLKIAMPLHMIFRSGSLIANMLMGVIILKRSYPISKYLSVILITIGVIVCTLMTGSDIKQEALSSGQDSFFWWSLGILLLIFALLVSARLGIYQEMLFRQHGKYPYEALYYTHLMPLPGFLLVYDSIIEHFKIAMNSTPIAVPFLGVNVPILILYLIGNVATQYLCISSVYYLTTETSSFTTTLVLTLRKFVSLLFSILYFQNKFTVYHWFGTFCVFAGTLIYTEIPQKLGSLQFLSRGSKKKSE